MVLLVTKGRKNSTSAPSSVITLYWLSIIYTSFRSPYFKPGIFDFVVHHLANSFKEEPGFTPFATFVNFPCLTVP